MSQQVVRLIKTPDLWEVKPNGDQADIYLNRDLFIAGIPMMVARQFVAHPEEFHDVFLGVPKLRAIVLAREILIADQSIGPAHDEPRA